MTSTTAAAALSIGNASARPPPSQPSTAAADEATATDRNKEKSDEKESEEAKRLSKTTAYLPFVYGSIAFYLGKKADEFQTHAWTLFVRGPNQEDLSVVISKVVFQLHASFAKPIRELTQPPFEVTERGWGEFEAQIRIIWKDPEEKPTVVSVKTKLSCLSQISPPQSLETATNEEIYLTSCMIYYFL
jgi:YEATS domain-containing protein 4